MHLGGTQFSSCTREHVSQERGKGGHVTEARRMWSRYEVQARPGEVPEVPRGGVIQGWSRLAEVKGRGQREIRKDGAGLPQCLGEAPQETRLVDSRVVPGSRPEMGAPSRTPPRRAVGGGREGALRDPVTPIPLNRVPCSKGRKKSFSSVLSSRGFRMWCSVCPPPGHRAKGVRADPGAPPLASRQLIPLGSARVEGGRVTGQGRRVSNPEPIPSSPVWVWR